MVWIQFILLRWWMSIRLWLLRLANYRAYIWCWCGRLNLGCFHRQCLWRPSWWWYYLLWIWYDPLRMLSILSISSNNIIRSYRWLAKLVISHSAVFAQKTSSSIRAGIYATLREFISINFCIYEKWRCPSVHKYVVQILNPVQCEPALYSARGFVKACSGRPTNPGPKYSFHLKSPDL